jgi:vacuolar fusion protein MON1
MDEQINVVPVVQQNVALESPTSSKLQGESMLVTTDSIKEFSHEISSTKVAAGVPQIRSVINEIQGKLDKCEISESGPSNMNLNVDPDTTMTKSESMLSVQSKDLCDQQDEKEDYLHNMEWLHEKKHVFILSTAGKPIYSLHGNENKLASLFGVLQALVSVVQATEDSINSIHVNGVKFVFLVKPPLILVAISRSGTSVQQIQMQLTDVYNQILSILTLSHMNKIFEKRKNFDLRRLLEGSERLIDHLLMNDSNSKKGRIFFWQTIRF